MTEEAAPEKKRRLRTLAPLRRLLPYALRYWLRIFLALIALSVAAGATLALPLAVRAMIDQGFSRDNAGSVNASFGALIGVVALLALASGSRYYLVMTLGERVVADLRADLFRHLTSLDARFYETAKTGELLSRLTADTTQLRSAFGASASVALRNFFLFVGAIVMMVMTSFKLSIIALAAIPVIVLPLIASGRAVRGRSRLAQDALADASGYAGENLAAVRTMQACGAEPQIVERFRRAAEGAYATARDATRLRALVTAGAIFLVSFSVVAVLWLGAQDVLAGKMTSGVLSQFVLYAVLGASSLGELSQVWTEAASAAGAAGRIGDILSVKPAISAPAKPKILKEPVRGRIAFEAVSFSYPSAKGVKAIDELTLTIEPGERVALVGPSGAGKSTIFQLLMRFYDVDSGAITLDGIEIRELDPRALRKSIALAPQDPVIFGTSVAENIAYGREGAPRREIEAAARRAQAHDFIEALPKGYDTVLGERGVTLSGGQRQRLAIARAILADAPVLLLDEATSALDAENEKLVQAALDDVMAGRTSLVIAHRLATVLEADRILVLDNGRIVEEGVHESLVEHGGLYARVARLQFNA
jgi:ATP-binding cassette subfamily B protein